MKLKIQLIGIFQIGRYKEAVREYPAATSVRMLVDELHLSTPLLGAVLINGIHADLEDQLKDGDTICILPLLGGG
jgi:molybdopterin synthase sulfur carrier subunit